MSPAMRLELADFPVREIRLGKAFGYQGATLEVDQHELADLVSQDPRIDEASIAVVHPGEKVRVTGIRDIVEPRIKVSGNGEIFPGTLNPVAGCRRRAHPSHVRYGSDGDRSLRGSARAGLAVQRSAILDMWDPGAQASRFSTLAGLVLVMTLKPGLSDLDSHTAVQLAEMKVAQRLAEVTVGLPPVHEEFSI